MNVNLRLPLGGQGIKVVDCRRKSSQLNVVFTSRMFSLRVIVSLLLVVSASASSVIFEDSSSASKDNTDVGTRNGPFDDSVVIEAAGSPSNGDVDSRFFGLLGGKLFSCRTRNLKKKKNLLLF